MKLLIDGDGCPVVDIAVTLARQYRMQCMILCDTSHTIQREGATTVNLSKGPDSVDFALVNRVQPGDVVVTQDYGLAAMCLAKRAIPIRQDGLIYTDDNMGALLTARHTAQKLRRGGRRLKGPKKRTAAEDEAFRQTLDELLRRIRPE